MSSREYELFEAPRCLPDSWPEPSGEEPWGDEAPWMPPQGTVEYEQYLRRLSGRVGKLKLIVDWPLK
jgi:hypothetical protein